MLLGIMLATTNGLAENNTPIVPYFAQGGIACSNVSSINADTWHCINYADMFGDIFVTDVTYTLSSDTTIHSMHYTKLIKNNNQCVGALRQSADGMKVYYYDVRSSEYLPDVEECLLYDFSANIGDTIKDAYFRLEDIRVYDCLMEPESVGWLVTDKYISDGRIHMIVARCYDDGMTQPRYYTHWIQGIGTPNGLWPTLYGTELNSILYTLCAAQGDETLYTYDLNSLGIVNNCAEWHYFTHDDVINDNQETLSVIVSGNELHVHTKCYQSQIIIFNLNGQCVLQSAQTDIDVSGLPKGMYILRAVTVDGQQYQAKFIKE